MRAAHQTRTEIARRLDEIAPRPSGGRWTTSGVERIIKNRVYMGEAYRGSAVNPDAHEAIVSFAEWQAANSGAGARVSPRQEAKPARWHRSLRGLSLRARAAGLWRRKTQPHTRLPLSRASTAPAPAQNPRASPETRSITTSRPFGASRWQGQAPLDQAGLRGASSGDRKARSRRRGAEGVCLRPHRSAPIG